MHTDMSKLLIAKDTLFGQNDNKNYESSFRPLTDTEQRHTWVTNSSFNQNIFSWQHELCQNLIPLSLQIHEFFNKKGDKFHHSTCTNYYSMCLDVLVLAHKRKTYNFQNSKRLRHCPWKCQDSILDLVFSCHHGEHSKSPQESGTKFLI